MDFDAEDREIKKILESYRLKKAPASLMRNYEKEVLQKIRAGSPKWGPGWQGVLLGAVIFALLGGLGFFWLLRPVGEKIPPSLPAPAPALSAASSPPVAETAKPIPVQAKVEDEDALFDQMANDLFVLEMLGEDEGLLDELDRVAADIEIWAQGQGAPFA